ncbi:MAG: hypothetical protein ACRD0U_02910 [Acidimicrobiales bacterium]
MSSFTPAVRLPGADRGAALDELRRVRRRKRLAEVHWVDALYQAYLTALLGGVAVLLGASAIGDQALSRSAVADARADGPAIVGLVAALALAVGLRSGSRGGPLALERADVRHVLLAPIDRGTALRPAALRQLRFGMFVGAVAGAIAGHLAANRLPGHDSAWSAGGALGGVVVAAVAYGSAMVTSGRRVRSWMATAVWVILLAWAVADAAGAIGFSPTSSAGALALWPLEWDPVGLAPVAVAAGLVAAGLAVIGGTSVEVAERRSTLVGQIRFAATLQDIRTVIVLRRQLAMELPRLRPWVRVRAKGTDRFPTWTRGWRGALRWPAARVGRTLLLAVSAGLALRGAWEGTTPLVIVAGLAAYVVALDAVEPLAQEIDHPSRRDTLPIPAGQLYLRQLPAATATMMLVGIVAAAAAVAVAPSRQAIELAAAVLVPGVLGATAAGVVSVVMGAPAASESNLLLPPEAAGMRVAGRAAWPPLLATSGVALPLLVARAAATGDQPTDPAQAAMAAGVGIVVLFALVCGWVRAREHIKAWWAAQVEQMVPAKSRQAASG